MATQLRAPKEGERWVPKSGRAGGFTVISDTKSELVVDVDRNLVNKETGEMKVETRRRSLAPKDVQFFVLGYERKTK